MKYSDAQKAAFLGLNPPTEYSHAFGARLVREGLCANLREAEKLFKHLQIVVEPIVAQTVNKIPPSPRRKRPVMRACVIPDLHCSPSVPNDRFLWLGRWCQDMKPDVIVQLGDWLTFDSLSTHQDPASIKARVLPSFRADIDAGLESMSLFKDGLGGIKARQVVTLGNHEARVLRFEDRNPPMAGKLFSEVEALFDRHEWVAHPYMEYVEIEGVNFVHHATGSSGKAYGGKTSGHRIGNDALASIVHGHTHLYSSISVPKIGHSHVTIVSAGCALPDGHVEEYAQHSATGWSYGALFMTIHEGRILDQHWWNMSTIERAYR